MKKLHCDRDDIVISGFPDTPGHVHLMGICGTGMAALAGMFREAGCTVTGSDEKTYPPMSDHLAALGISVTEGYTGANLITKPDLVVVGNVIRRTNPEAQALKSSGIAVASMPDALMHYFIGDKKRIVVTGTHGKTTVSSMAAWILFRSGLDPSFLIGGLPLNFNANYRLGKGSVCVVEGDEYDTAYFDKTPKFLHYAPDVAIVTSCEFDHGDIYNNLDDIKGQFRNFCRLVPPLGKIIAFIDDHNVSDCLHGAAARVETYGQDPSCHWRPIPVSTKNPDGFHTTIFHLGEVVAEGFLQMTGLHNILNATSAIAATSALGVPPQAAMNALTEFRGVTRRQQVLGDFQGIILMDDFAHHPTAVRETCAGVRMRFPNRRLVAIFEPRSNTSRRAFFQDTYPNSFEAADLVIARSPSNSDAIPVDERFDSHKLAADLRAKGKEAFSFNDTDRIMDFCSSELRRADVVLIMSNGSFDNLAQRLKRILQERET
jgi:UDP-N-acetylmuramate: L-alanyl-gamma-D-glutamyl-meso-diaminopimelate ligase